MKEILFRTTAMVLTVALALSAFGGGAAAQTSDGDAGVCVIGVDSPCNGEQWDGDGQNGDLPSGDVPEELPGDIPSGDVPSEVPGELPGDVPSGEWPSDVRLPA